MKLDYIIQEIKASCWKSRIREVGGYLNNVNDQKYIIPINIAAETKVSPSCPLATCLLWGFYEQTSWEEMEIKFPQRGLLMCSIWNGFLEKRTVRGPFVNFTLRVLGENGKSGRAGNNHKEHTPSNPRYKHSLLMCWFQFMNEISTSVIFKDTLSQLLWLTIKHRKFRSS